jgi:hypothetical protein
VGAAAWLTRQRGISMSTNNKLFWATLVESSPRFAQWREVLGSTDVPIKSPISSFAELADGRDDVYEIDLESLDQEQLTRLVDFVVKRFGADSDLVRSTILDEGFPIRASDVIVAMSLRAFL